MNSTLWPALTTYQTAESTSTIFSFASLSVFSRAMYNVQHCGQQAVQMTTTTPPEGGVIEMLLCCRDLLGFVNDLVPVCRVHSNACAVQRSLALIADLAAVCSVHSSDVQRSLRLRH